MTIDLTQVADIFDALSRQIRSSAMGEPKTKALVLASAAGGIKKLQSVLGVQVDGIFGPASETALRLVDVDVLINGMIAPAAPAPLPPPPTPTDPVQPPPSNPYTAEYESDYNSMTIRPNWMAEIQTIAHRIQQNAGRYQLVADNIGLTYWPLIGIIHNLESNINFTTHLYNGDPLSSRTVHNPVGRPITGNPPFTWEFSAIDALKYKGFDKWHDWSIPGMALMLEAYNGFGYRIRGMPSPYLWSGSSIYTRGFYTSDGHFDPNAVSKQIGGMTMLKYLSTQGI